MRSRPMFYLLRPSLDAHGGVVIAGSQDVRVLEGDWQPDSVLVLISFPRWRAHWSGTSPRSTARR
jgi:uncharacterized protein (DUF1330 family)